MKRSSHRKVLSCPYPVQSCSGSLLKKLTRMYYFTLFVQRYVLHTRKSQMTHSSSHFSLSKNQFFWFCLRSWLVLGWVKEKVLLWWVRRSTISRYICTFYIVIRACIWFYTHTFKATLCNVCRHMCAEKTCCFQSAGAHSDFLESNIQWTDYSIFKFHKINVPYQRDQCLSS